MKILFEFGCYFAISDFRFTLSHFPLNIFVQMARNIRVRICYLDDFSSGELTHDTLTRDWLIPRFLSVNQYQSVEETDIDQGKNRTPPAMNRTAIWEAENGQQANWIIDRSQIVKNIEHHQKRVRRDKRNMNSQKSFFRRFLTGKISVTNFLIHQESRFTRAKIWKFG